MKLLNKFSKTALALLLGVLLMGNAPKSDRPDICNVFGGIFVSDTPRGVDFRVFEDDSEAFADLLVYEEENKLFADRKGIWFFTEDRNFADYIIYFTKERGGSEFSVYFTDTESFAGCNQ